jgi:hypothetical protein
MRRRNMQGLAKNYSQINSCSTKRMEWIRSLMHQLFFGFLCHQLDKKFLLVVVYLCFTLSGF